MQLSVGVMAYNEEANIKGLLEALNQQVSEISRIKEIIVVASGCTDNTVSIVKTCAESDSRIKLIEQDEREGKSSAINLFIKAATGDVLIIESGDTLPISNTCEKLVRPFLDPNIGMTGARPVPLNDPHHFMGYAAHFLWRLHHQLALYGAKLGEMVAIRNVISRIPADTAVDEASIEALITQQGLKLAYAPDALVLNKGPDTISDFLKQRRRIANGHLHLKHSQGYTTSTLGTSLIRQVLKDAFVQKIRRLRKLLHAKRYNAFNICLSGYIQRGFWALGVIGLEIWGRLLGGYDFYFAKKNPVKWDIATTTKRLQ